MTTTIWLLIVSVIVALGRFTVPGHGLSYPLTYEAFAHIFVGALIAIAVLRKDIRRQVILLLVAISTLELVMFLIGQRGA